MEGYIGAVLKYERSARETEDKQISGSGYNLYEYLEAYKCVYYRKENMPIILALVKYLSLHILIYVTIKCLTEFFKSDSIFGYLCSHINGT